MFALQKALDRLCEALLVYSLDIFLPTNATGVASPPIRRIHRPSAPRLLLGLVVLDRLLSKVGTFPLC